MKALALKRCQERSGHPASVRGRSLTTGANGKAVSKSERLPTRSAASEATQMGVVSGVSAQ